MAAAALLDIGEGLSPVDIGPAASEHVQLGAVEDKNFWRLGHLRVPVDPDRQALGYPAVTVQPGPSPRWPCPHAAAPSRPGALSTPWRAARRAPRAPPPCSPP